jgi:glutaredoxin
MSQPASFVEPAGSPRVILYARAGCHLCDEAEALLVRHGLRPRLVDIDADPALRARYNECVPVVEIDGRERFRGQVNEVLLKRILAGKADDVTPSGRGPG